MPELEEVGITAEGLSRVASNLQKTRQVVEYIIRKRPRRWSLFRRLENTC